jgi:hypothetical protein
MSKYIPNTTSSRGYDDTVSSGLSGLIAVWDSFLLDSMTFPSQLNCHAPLNLGIFDLYINYNTRRHRFPSLAWVGEHARTGNNNDMLNPSLSLPTTWWLVSRQERFPCYWHLVLLPGSLSGLPSLSLCSDIHSPACRQVTRGELASFAVRFVQFWGGLRGC